MRRRKRSLYVVGVILLGIAIGVATALLGNWLGGDLKILR